MNVKHVSLVNNATTGLIIAQRALGFQKEIITSSLIKNLQENYDKTLNKEKLIIIDHEE